LGSVAAPASSTCRMTRTPTTKIRWSALIAMVAVTATLMACATGTPVAEIGRTPRQTVLPFTGLQNPSDVAVDTDGNVYVTDTRDGDSRVIELPAGSHTPRLLRFTHASLLADAGGAVWVLDDGADQLLRLASTATVPVPDFGRHGGVGAVDAAGLVYGTNGGGIAPGGGCSPVHVMRSAHAPSEPTVLPFTGLDGVGGMAVDVAGNVYVGDADRGRVLQLRPGSDAPIVLPFSHIDGLVDVVVDSSGTVYAVDAGQRRILTLAAGSVDPTPLPFTGLDHPVSVATDTAGDVYVVDSGTRRVVELTSGDPS
jgi:serine/threonine protein kinase, bacterial